MRVDCGVALLVLEGVVEVNVVELLLEEVELILEEDVLEVELEVEVVVVSALVLLGLELSTEEVVAVAEASGFEAVPVATVAEEVAYTPAPQRKKPRSP